MWSPFSIFAILLLVGQWSSIMSQDPPSSQPTSFPSAQPSSRPSRLPTGQPTRLPISLPTGRPSRLPTGQPTRLPISLPTSRPSRLPTGQPSRSPSRIPTSQPSRNPTSQPTTNPTSPTGQPSRRPSSQPSSSPTNPTGQPSRQPTSQPSRPTFAPTTALPTPKPTFKPTYVIQTSIQFQVQQQVTRITSSQFTSNSQTIFKSTVATILGRSINEVLIINYANEVRRGLLAASASASASLEYLQDSAEMKSETKKKDGESTLKKYFHRYLKTLNSWMSSTSPLQYITMERGDSENSFLRGDEMDRHGRQLLSAIDVRYQVSYIVEGNITAAMASFTAASITLTNAATSGAFTSSLQSAGLNINSSVLYVLTPVYNVATQFPTSQPTEGVPMTDDPWAVGAEDFLLVIIIPGAVFVMTFIACCVVCRNMEKRQKQEEARLQEEEKAKREEERLAALAARRQAIKQPVNKEPSQPNPVSTPGMKNATRNLVEEEEELWDQGSSLVVLSRQGPQNSRDIQSKLANKKLFTKSEHSPFLQVSYEEAPAPADAGGGGILGFFLAPFCAAPPMATFTAVPQGEEEVPSIEVKVEGGENQEESKEAVGIDIESNVPLAPDAPDTNIGSEESNLDIRLEGEEPKIPKSSKLQKKPMGTEAKGEGEEGLPPPVSKEEKKKKKKKDPSGGEGEAKVDVEVNLPQVSLELAAQNNGTEDAAGQPEAPPPPQPKKKKVGKKKEEK